MHKSKLAGFIIDCQTENLPEAAAFWGAALGMAVQALPGEEGEKYVRLNDRFEQLHVEVQKVQHDSRVHLDIETDNIEAEVKRLEQLGARVVRRVHAWCVMRAPTGQQFCVVKAGSKDFAERANQWPDS
jgi:predicted enzyme related to lactoylglutathione lyase